MTKQIDITDVHLVAAIKLFHLETLTDKQEAWLDHYWDSRTPKQMEQIIAWENQLEQDLLAEKQGETKYFKVPD